MTRAEMIDLLHMTPDGEYMYSPLLGESEMDWIDSHPAIVAPLVAARRNAAGFYVSFPSAIQQILKRATILSLDLETTNLTPHAPAVTVTNKTHIGEEPYHSYRARHPECAINTRPRIRVLAVHVLDGSCPGEYVFDLDQMSPADRQRLIDTVVHDTVLVGHNIVGFDLFWLLQETDKEPKYILDTLILTRQVKPEILTYLNYDAATGDEQRAEEATEMLQGKSESRASLEFIAASLGLPFLDKTYQRPENWCVSILSPQHLAYVLDDIRTPLSILEHIFGTTNAIEIRQQIRQYYPWYNTFLNAAYRMIKTKGVPFSDSGAAVLMTELTAELAEAVQVFRQWPEFSEEAMAILANPRKANQNKAVLDCMTAHAAAHGLTLPVTEKGSTSIAEKAMKLANLTHTLPCWSALDRVAKLKKSLDTIAGYREHVVNGRIRSLISFTTAAGRTSCSAPSLQNMPRYSKLRALVEATEGKTLLGADYSAIELRIAAVNAEQAIKRMRKELNARYSGDELDYFHRQCLAGIKARSAVEYSPVEPPGSSSEDAQEWSKTRPGKLITYFAQNTLQKKEQNLTRVFRLGLDSHLVTALDMVRRSGQIEIEGDIISWLQTRAREEVKILKERYAEQRQQAKAINFGLLYRMSDQTLHETGITNYGVRWTLEQAAAARTTWFQLYPELGLWHLHTKYVCARKLQPNDVMLWDRYTQQVGKSAYGARLYQTSSLTGRPFVILNSQNQALSYQGQGTGADILVRAINDLPPHLLEALILSVHDELIFEVPLERADQYKTELEQVMIHAGHRVLKGVVPVVVEAKTGKSWSK